MRSHFTPFVSVLMVAIFILLTLTASCTGGAGQPLETQTGLASFYGRAFHGQMTASGEPFDMNDLVAAHPSYPLGTRVRITNLENNRTVEARIVDRGPTEENQEEGVIIDLSRVAAREIGMISEGRAKVRVDVLEWGSPSQEPQGGAGQD